MDKNRKEHSRSYGPMMMLGASLCFATGGLLCKWIPWSPLAINGVRNLLAALVVGSYLLLTRHRLRFNRFTFFGAVCYMGVTSLFVAANKMTTAANAIVLQYTAPIWIVLMMALFFQQKPKKEELVTLAAVLVGILCFFFDSLSAGNGLGNLLAVLSGVFYAGLFILNSFEQGDTLSALLLGQVVSGIALGPLAIREAERGLPVMGAVLALGVIQVGVAYIFFAEGTGHTGPVAASLINAVEPIVNPLLVALCFGELLAPLALVGGCIVLLAVVGCNLYQTFKNRAAERRKAGTPR